MLYNVLNSAVSIAVAGVVLGGLDVECASAQNVRTCAAIGAFYGILVLFGATAVGAFAAINGSLAYLTMRDDAPTPDDRKVDL